MPSLLNRKKHTYSPVGKHFASFVTKVDEAGTRFEPCFSCRKAEPLFMHFAVETEQESDGRWLAEIPQLPGALVYGTTREEAIIRVKALALRVLADRIEHGEAPTELKEVFSVAV